MPLATPLLPVIILLLGAVLLPLTKRTARVQITNVLAAILAGSCLLFSLLLYRYQPNSINFSIWRPAPLFGVQLGYYMDNLSLLFVSLIGLITLVAIISQRAFLIPEDERGHPYGAIFLLAAGGVSLILSADLVTLCFSWGFLDLALLFLTALLHRGKAASRMGVRLLLINYLAGLALFLAALFLLEARGASLSLQATPLPTKVISLAMLAALMRVGLYPAFVALPVDVEMNLPTLIVWYVTPLSAGGYLLARMLTLASVATLPGKEAALFLGSLALVLSPFPLWFESSLRRSASYIVLNQVGYLTLASAISVPHSAAIISSQVISLTLALSLLFLGHMTSRDPMPHPYGLWTRICTFAAVASLVGTPLTVGFASRWLLYESLWDLGLGPLILLSLLSNSFLLAPLSKMFLEPTSPGTDQGAIRPLLLASMSGLAILLLILGLHPPLIGRMVGPPGGLSTLPALPDLIYSQEPSFSLVLLAGTLLSLLLGYLMYRKGETIVTKAGVSLETLQMIAEMGWLYRALDWTAQRTATILEQLGGFFEGRHSLGWILLFATLVTLLLLSS